MKVAIIDPSGFTLPYDHCLATALTNRGCEVVLVSSRAPQTSWTTSNSYEIWRDFYRIGRQLKKNKLRVYFKGCEHPFNMEKLLHSLQRWHPDVIHFQWLPFPAVDMFFLQRFNKIAPIILTIHDTKPFHGSPSSWFQLVGLRSALKCFDHYIVHTLYSKKVLMHQLALLERQVTVIPHGVFNYYCEMVSNESLQLTPQVVRNKRILFFGTLKPYKGLDVLLKAFARLPVPLANETALQIVGQPKMPVESLHALAERLKIEARVFWDLRFVEEREVAIYFANSDIIVLPYRRIDQSGVLMVALAFSKPVVASRIGGFEETIDDGVHGFLVEPGDVESLTRALAHILENDDLRKQMAKAVHELASGELSWESIASKTLSVYANTVANWISRQSKP